MVDTAIWWCALGLIPLVLLPNGAEKIWWEAAFECAVFSLGALWIANGFLRGSWPLGDVKLLAPLLLLVAYAFIQTLPIMPEGAGVMQSPGRQPISADPSGTYHFIAKLLALITFAKLLLDYTRDRRRLSWLVYVVIAASVAISVVGIIRMFAQITSPELVLFGKAQWEGFAHFANRNHFALMLEMSFGLGLGFVLRPGLNRQLLLLHAGLVLLLATTIVATTSRGGVLAMVSQVLFLAVWFSLQRIWSDKPKVREQNGLLAPRSIVRLALSMALIWGLVIVDTNRHRRPRRREVGRSYGKTAWRIW